METEPISYNVTKMPNDQALQVFYGTIPLILIVAAAWMRESMLLKDILQRLSGIEKEISGVKERLTALETRAGIIFHS